MKSMDAMTNNGPNKSAALMSWKTKVSWKTKATMLAGLAAVGVICWVIRQSGPQDANAQAPVQGPSRQQVAGSNTSNASARPDVLAVVNGQRISRHDLGQACLERFGQEILESLVNQKLIWSACQERGVNITAADVQTEVQTIAKKFGLSTERWLELLETERDISPDKYQTDIIWPTLALRSLATKQITVTQEEMNKAYESEQGAQVQVRLIAVSSRETANEIYNQVIQDPRTFGDVAKDRSEDTGTASVGGIVPPIRKHVGDPQIESIAFSMTPGEISKPLQVANQYLILMCERQIPAPKLTQEQVNEVWSQLHQRIVDHKLRDSSNAMFAELQKSAKIVNVINTPSLQAQMPGVAATVNGHKITIQELSDECIARYGTDVLDGEINRVLLDNALQSEQQTVTDADIDAEIDRAADAFGYLTKAGTPDRNRWLKHITEQEKVSLDLYVRDAVWPTVALKKLVSQYVKVDDSDLHKGFESNYGERVRVMAIVLSNHRQAQKVWEMARQTSTDHVFGELAHQYSVEPASRANYGHVPPIRKHSGQTLVEAEAFKLKPGEVSQIIAVTDKFIIIRCLGRTKPVVGPEDYAAVKDELYKDIYEKKLRKYMAKQFDKIRSTAKIENYLAGIPAEAGVATKASFTPPATR